MNSKSYTIITCLLFLILGLTFVLTTYSHPIADFGNYYYGSKLFLNKLFTTEMYTSIQYFNNEIGKLGETQYFENYIPVPPITAIIYTPLCFFKPLLAKCLFNIVGLLLFCFTIYKLLIFLEIKKPIVILLPFLFIYPIYNNIYQGQAYLFIISALILSYIYSETKLIHLPALLLALCISLKLFPIMILIYFILTKKYKIIVYTLIYSLALLFITIIFIDINIVSYYYIKITPRLINNDIVGTYSSINQSIYSLLLNIFTESSLNKTMPIIKLPNFVPLIESFCVGTVLYYLYKSKNKHSLFIFGLTLFSLLLINRYNTTYSLVMLIPFIIYILNEYSLKFNCVILMLLFFISLNLPVGAFVNYFIILKFLRIILFIITFLVVLNTYKIDFNLKVLGSIIACTFVLKYYTFNVSSFKYFEAQNSLGILYDFDIKHDTLILKSTLGEKKLIECYNLKGKAYFDKNLVCENNLLRYKNNIICNTTDNKQKPFIYKDTIVVFMSDLNQGIRFYKLRCLPLNEKQQH